MARHGSPACREIGPCTGTGNPTWEDTRLYAHLGVLYGTPIRSGEDMVPMARGVNVARRAVIVIIVFHRRRRYGLLSC